MSLPEALERAATELPQDADAIRPANGDPVGLLELLDPEAASRVLCWLLSNEFESGAELAASWAEEEAGIEVLRGVSESSLPKAGRKALRRALHRLRSQGVELPEEKATEPVVARLPRIEDSFEFAFVSSLDPRGARLVFLTLPNPSGGARMFELLLDELRGVLDFRVYSAGRSKVRKFLKAIESGDGLATAAAEPAAVKALIGRVAAAHPADQPLPRSFSEWRSRIVLEGEGARTPGQLARETLGNDDSPSLLRQAVELVREEVLGPWPPSNERLGELAEKIRSASEGTVILNEAQQHDRVRDALEAAVAELYQGDFAELTAARFEESAYHFWKGEQEERARAALAAANAFRATSPGDNPVAVALLEIAFAPLLKSLREQEAGTDQENPTDQGEGEADSPALVRS